MFYLLWRNGSQRNEMKFNLENGITFWCKAKSFNLWRIEKTQINLNMIHKIKTKNPSRDKTQTYLLVNQEFENLIEQNQVVILVS